MAALNELDPITAVGMNASSLINYNAAARGYDHVRGIMGIDDLTAAIRTACNNLAVTVAQSNGLAMCCGTAEQERLIARTLAGMGERFGRLALLDGSEGMLEVAKGKMSDASDVTFHCHDVTKPLPFGDGTMSWVTIVQAIQHFDKTDRALFPNVGSALAEAARVLMPGGTLCVVHSYPEQITRPQWHLNILHGVVAPNLDPCVQFAAAYPPRNVVLGHLERAGLVVTGERMLEGAYVTLDVYLGDPKEFLDGPLAPAIHSSTSFYAAVQTSGQKDAYFARLRSMIQDGSIIEHRNRCEVLRKQIGMATLITAVKAH